MLSRIRFLAPMLGVLCFASTACAEGFTQAKAVAEAMAKSPRIASAEATVNIARGALRQAGAYNNPTLGIEGENIGGNGPYRGFDSAELTYGLSQEIALGGKISARGKAATYQLTMAQLDASIIRQDVARDVKQAFATAVAAQEARRLAGEALTIAQQEMKSVSRRVAEAASPLIQKSKAEVTLATARFNVEQASQDEAMARTQLASLLGRAALETPLAAEGFFDVAEPAAAAPEALERTADMQRLRLDQQHAKAVLDIEKANAIPDPTVSLGVRELRESDDRAFVLGLSIPLPVLNANGGNIAQARAGVSRASSDGHTAQLALQQRYTLARTALRTAWLKASSYRSTVLPAAEQAFTLSRQGYGAGKFQYLEVLDAQRTLFGARTEYVAALRDYHLRQADLERLSTPYTPTNGDKHEE